jgi:hypothetical protein
MFKFLGKPSFQKLPKIKFVGISSKIEYFYHLQIANLHH